MSDIDQHEIDNAPTIPVNCHSCAERAVLIQRIAELEAALSVIAEDGCAEGVRQHIAKQALSGKVVSE